MSQPYGQTYGALLQIIIGRNWTPKRQERKKDKARNGKKCGAV